MTTGVNVDFISNCFFTCKDRALERDRPYQREKMWAQNRATPLVVHQQKMWAQNRATPLVVHQLNRLDTFKSGCSAWRCLRRALKSLGLRRTSTIARQLFARMIVRSRGKRQTTRKSPSQICVLSPLSPSLSFFLSPSLSPNLSFFLFPFVAGGLILFFSCSVLLGVLKAFLRCPPWCWRVCPPS